MAANRKLSFPNARVCVFNISDLKDYGETAIQHVEIDVKLTYGKKTKTVTWTFDCNVPIDSIQPAQ